jgi:hypothetical protein
MNTSTTQNRFSSSFDSYVCEGDTISAEIDGFTIEARIVRDTDAHIDDDDSHNTDQNVTGCNWEQQRQLLNARAAWFNDRWFYCGVVLSVSKRGVLLNKNAASLWCIDANYPRTSTSSDTEPNAYLTQVANELIDEALQAGRATLAHLIE